MLLAHSGAFRPGKTTAGSDTPACPGSSGSRKNCQGVPSSSCGETGWRCPVPSFDEDPRSRPSLGGPHLTPTLPAGPGTLAKASSSRQGIRQSPGQQGRRRWRGSVYAYKGQGTGSDSSPEAPGKPAPHSPHPLGFTASWSCRWGGAPPRSAPSLPPSHGGLGLSGWRAAGLCRNSPSSRDSGSLSGKSLCEVCSRPRACGEIQGGREGRGKN